MKSIKRIFIVAILILICLVPKTAFASDTADWKDIYLSDEEISYILNISSDNETETYASGLIIRGSFSASKKGNSVTIIGNTYCTSDVVKCGFSKIVIKQRKNANSSWRNYKSYSDLYANSNKYALSKSIELPKGYQYQIVATHYAKKNAFSTQKIDSYSEILSI